MDHSGVYATCDTCQTYHVCNRGGNCHVSYLTINWLELKSTPHSCTLKHRTTILISSTHHIINDYSKLFIVAIPNKTIKILPYLVTRAKLPLLVHISRSIDAFATAKQPYESSWSVQSPETIEKCSFTFLGQRAPDLRFEEASHFQGSRSVSLLIPEIDLLRLYTLLNWPDLCILFNWSWKVVFKPVERVIT